ncbi:hypothetical protein LBMAG42_00550 [Deltaproteobacteria bacterium]|nr:hypothetical protein LBMAG42_00550 [Deltaproteobacteria bacterium]
MFAPLLLLPLLAGCGPSRQELAGLERILAKDPFPRSSEDFADALTLLPDLPAEDTACDVAFESDANKGRYDVETWPTTHPDVVGRRGTTKPRWLPLQVGRVTIARSPGTAAAQGSASHAARAFALKNFDLAPGVEDMEFEEKLLAAQALHERDLEPELVVIVGDVEHVYGWLYDPLQRRMVCGGQVPITGDETRKDLAAWTSTNPPAAPDLAGVERLTRLAVTALRKLPAPPEPELGSLQPAPAGLATAPDATATPP